jgi:K(+)-stimulated pyrophosphate-energized sodium pump
MMIRIGAEASGPIENCTTAGAINPLIKVMNLVSVLIAPAVVQFSIGPDASAPIRIIIALVAFAIIVAAVVISKRRGTVLSDTPAQVTSA